MKNLSAIYKNLREFGFVYRNPKYTELQKILDFSDF